MVQIFVVGREDSVEAVRYEKVEDCDRDKDK